MAYTDDIQLVAKNLDAAAMGDITALRVDILKARIHLAPGKYFALSQH